MTSDAPGYEQLILDYFLAVDEERLNDIVDCFTPEGSIQFPFQDEPVAGPDDLRGFFAEHVGRFSRHVDRVTRMIIDGDRGISEIVFDATTSDGRPVHFETCNVYRFRDGRFDQVRVYLDTVTLERQLGL
jgi:ketosteroid isomerase-like protein